jgi:hypothetical protein
MLLNGRKNVQYSTGASRNFSGFYVGLIDINYILKGELIRIPNTDTYKGQETPNDTIRRNK